MLNLCKYGLSRDSRDYLQLITTPGFKKANFESLELRRLRADLVVVDIIIFGIIRLDGKLIDFSLRNRPHLRGHSYILNKPQRAVSSQLRYVSTIGKKLLKSNISSIRLYNMANVGPLTAEIGLPVWGTPAHFNGFRVLAALLHGTLVMGVSQTLRR